MSTCNQITFYSLNPWQALQVLSFPSWAFSDHASVQLGFFRSILSHFVQSPAIISWKKHAPTNQPTNQPTTHTANQPPTQPTHQTKNQKTPLTTKILEFWRDEAPHQPFLYRCQSPVWSADGTRAKKFCILLRNAATADLIVPRHLSQKDCCTYENQNKTTNKQENKPTQPNKTLK